MELEERALAELDADALISDAAELVCVPSVTGDERAVVERFVALARSRGTHAELAVHDLDAVRADPGYPGEEAARDELVGGVVRVRGRAGSAPRICLAGHLDVVPPGSEEWARGPWSGAVENGQLHGRGSVDMKGAVAAALHAVAAIGAAGGSAGEVTLLGVASEEDGGLGAFAALRDDDAFDACIITEPTGFDVACAQAGALTFLGEVPGVGAHAAVRLEGVSAVDRYLPVHQALAELERELNANVTHPLMREHALPYPLSVGRVEAGRWSSSVPDRLVFEGRVGVPVGGSPEDVRAQVGQAVRAACPDAVVTWTGGAFGPGETRVDHPLTRTALTAATDETGRPARPIGVTYGADMRLFCERGIPCVMVGTPGLERAHAVDEWVATEDLVTLARILVRTIARLGG